MLKRLMSVEWVVYSKPCLGHTERVVDYLARYTHRIALSDARLMGIDGARVSLRYLDYRAGRAARILWLDVEELARRFLLHVLPKGFMRVRHFGFLANRCRSECLKRIRAAVQSAEPGCESASSAKSDTIALPLESCPRCHNAVLHLVAEIAPVRRDGG